MYNLRILLKASDPMLMIFHWADSLLIVCMMIDQVMELHPGIRYFHIGADEVSLYAWKFKELKHFLILIFLMKIWINLDLVWELNKNLN